MTQKERLEKIIVGTLLESNERQNYFDECRCCITADMFSDDRRRRIYGIIADMNANGKVETDPNSIVEAYGERVLDLLPTMLDLVVDYSFIHLKTEHNERIFRTSFVTGTKPHYADVSFTLYVNTFLKMYEDEKGKVPFGANAAAA